MDNADIKVSVIVLTYNHEKYIKKALDSILMQNVDFRYEILVGDDASTDNTAEILKEYHQKYGDIFRLFLHDQNLGATRNAYELLMSARGTYLATCEGDDYWTDAHKLQRQVRFLEEHKEYVGTAHHFTVVDAQGIPKRKQRISWVKYKKRFTIKDFKGIYLPGQPSTFVRRNIFLSSKKDFSAIYKLHPMIADRTLMLLFLSFGDFYTFNQKMSCYRQRDSDEMSLTERLYRRKTKRVEMDYELNDRLEQYASELFGQKIVFSRRRNDLFVSAIFVLLMTKDNQIIKLIGRMLKESRCPLILLLTTPYYMAKKTVLKMKQW